MLNNFWELNGKFRTVDSMEEFYNSLKISRHLCDILYKPDKMSPIDSKTKRIKGVVFENISFSKTTFENILFEDCTFKDCLFIGSRFNRCRIKNCNFICVNMAYCSFSNTYVRPDNLKNIFLRPIGYENIAVSFYQNLFDSLRESNQTRLASEAEYYFMYWDKRYNLYKLKKEITSADRKVFMTLKQIYVCIICILSSFVGYGIRVRNYVYTSLSIYILFFMWNKYWWKEFHFTSLFPMEDPSWYHILFFTFYTVTSLGAAPEASMSQWGILSAMFEGVIGWLLLGIGLAMIIKKIVR